MLLAPLPPVTRTSAAVIRILGANPGQFTLQGTNTYLVGTGRARLLIDTGEGQPAWADTLAQTLADEKATIDAVLLTHWHNDHVGGVEAVRALVPGVRVFQSHRAGRAVADAIELADGDEFAVEGAVLHAVHMPGHAADHMVFVLASEGAVFAGDNVLGHGTAVFEDFAAYLRSLHAMAALYDDLPGTTLYPGHGPVVDDGVTRIREYIAHRQQREAQVLQLIAEGADDGTTPVQLVARIYAGVRTELLGAAERGLVQILHKLEAEGRVKRTSNGAWLLPARSPL